MTHYAFQRRDLALQLLDLGARCGHVLVVALFLGVQFAQQPFHLHARGVVFLHQRVVFQINLLSLILVEVGVELIELVGQYQLVVGYGQRIGARLRLVTRHGVAVIFDNQHYNQGNQRHQDAGRRIYYYLDILIHTANLTNKSELSKMQIKS